MKHVTSVLKTLYFQYTFNKIHVHVHVYVHVVAEPTQLFMYMYMYMYMYMVCAVFALPCCLFDLARFFLPSSSL